MMKGGTSQTISSFYFRNSWIYVEIITQNVNFPIGQVQYLACQNPHIMYKVTLIVNKFHMVYTYCVNRRTLKELVRWRRVLNASSGHSIQKRSPQIFKSPTVQSRWSLQIHGTLQMKWFLQNAYYFYLCNFTFNFYMLLYNWILNFMYF